MRETPLFGSQRGASAWSDDLRSAAVTADVITILLAPSGEDTGSWIVNKAKGYAVDLAAASAAIGATSLLKAAAGRTRPSGADNESFPSGHTTTAATYNRLAARNLEYLDMNAVTRQGLIYGLDALTLGAAWARVEAGAHYPSDTLVSIALGNFSANFFKDAFMGSADRGRQQYVAVVPTHGGLMLRWNVGF